MKKIDKVANAPYTRDTRLHQTPAASLQPLSTKARYETPEDGDRSRTATETGNGPGHTDAVILWTGVSYAIAIYPYGADYDDEYDVTVYVASSESFYETLSLMAMTGGQCSWYYVGLKGGGKSSVIRRDRVSWTSVPEDVGCLPGACWKRACHRRRQFPKPLLFPALSHPLHLPRILPHQLAANLCQMPRSNQAASFRRVILESPSWTGSHKEIMSWTWSRTIC